MLLRRLEESGVGVEPVEPGCVPTTRRPVSNGCPVASTRRRAGSRRSGPVRRRVVGAATRRFAALAAASLRRQVVHLSSTTGETALFLEPLPLDLLPSPRPAKRASRSPGSESSASSPAYPARRSPSVWARTEQTPWRLARETTEAASNREFLLVGSPSRSASRKRIGNAARPGTGARVLLDRLLARPEHGWRAPRQLAVSARLVGGGSATCSDASPADCRYGAAPVRARTKAGRAARAADPSLRLGSGALVGLRRRSGRSLVRPARAQASNGLLADGLRQARAAAADRRWFCTVVEVAPGRAHRRRRCSCRATTERARPARVTAPQDVPETGCRVSR